jgi:S1-C subfamily serine protease
MNLARSSVAAPGSRRAAILSLLVAGSLLVSACDLGGSTSPPPGGSSAQPPNINQPQATAPGAANGQTGASGGTGFVPGGTLPATNAPAASGGQGSAGQAGGNAGPSVVAGGVTAMFDQVAGAAPVNGTDPASQPIVQMVQKVNPAVVTVVNTLDPASSGGYGGEARGSGAIIDQQGYIVTNNHVVEGEQSLVVIFADGSKQQVQLVGTAPDSDLAVLKASGQMPGVVAVGDSEKLMPGEVVVAIGSALGEFLNTVTVGVVSGLHRSLPEGNGVTIQNLIQTDAAINHGNSGGPLLNLAGELVGINTLGVTQAGQGDIAQGLGFAIPSSSVKITVAQIIQQGGTVTAARPYLGVSIRPVDARLASYYNLTGPDGKLLNDGALVTDVAANGPAAQAGVQPGDVIVGVNNDAVTADTPLGDVLTKYKPNDQVTLHVIRKGQAGTITVKLGNRPNQ